MLFSKVPNSSLLRGWLRFDKSPEAIRAKSRFTFLSGFSIARVVKIEIAIINIIKTIVIITTELIPVFMAAFALVCKALKRSSANLLSSIS